jgi:peptidoglycan-associated lipoprotein
MSKRHLFFVLFVVLALVAAGCKKKVPVQSPKTTTPPVTKPGPSPAPMIDSFTANPPTVERGKASTLRWETRSATEVSIDGIGTVPATGSRQVFPADTTRYRMVAKGPGGQTEASVAVNVQAPEEAAAPTPSVTGPARKSFLERLQSEIQDVYFDYDKSEIREDSRATLHRDADALKALFKDFPTAIINLEGHCDERGSAEYNLGLGDRRATSVKEFLVQIGVPAERLRTISYGKERQQCTESSEDCWQKNRRAHFSAQ